MTDEPCRVLVTGFGPFPGAPTNPTAALAQAIAAAGLPGVAAHVLPVTWAGTGPSLRGLIDRLAPQAVLMFGLAGRSRIIRVETRAANRALARHDADGAMPAGGQLDPDGPAHRPARADLARVLEAIRGSGARARLSRDAGGYLCNAALWTALAHTGEATPVLFVHVPLPPLHTRAKRPWLSQDTLLAAAKAAIGALRLPG